MSFRVSEPLGDGARASGAVGEGGAVAVLVAVVLTVAACLIVVACWIVWRLAKLVWRGARAGWLRYRPSGDVVEEELHG